ncbi:PadR family transcriptional regulator [Micromonospora sp. NPDC049044]|uniref:PadR family transcriptional regulator n=1 Tax=unclassified Micromonospora TaxID=2617518 RepID=UPI0033C77361
MTQWPAEWLRGALTLCVLGVLADGPEYGYAIAQRLDDAGLGTVKGGTLYPLLARLEMDGLVRSTWQTGAAGPGRKYFALTPAGHRDLANRSRDWDRFVDATKRTLTTSQETP